MRKTILIVDDEPESIQVLQRFLSKKYNVLTADTGTKALGTLNQTNVDLMLLDLGLPDISGIAVLEKMKETSCETDVLVISGSRDIKMAVKAMKLGAYNYIEKPPNFEEVSMVIKEIFEKHELVNEVRYLRSELEDRAVGSNGIIGSSGRINEVLDVMNKAAKTDASVFITGESGTGKELIARAIHAGSARKDRPFVAVSCPNLPTELVESELFGHEKGAFTSAIKSKVGKFEMANGGTIFLDEIAELAPSMQARLLRVVQEREFTLVGGTKTIKVNVRIVAATNRIISDEIKKGSFRKDLYYRLNVIPITLPPLCQRKDDIPLLVNYFINQLRSELHCKARRFSSKTIDALQLYNWPGNIRELRNIVERVMSLHGESETIRPDHLPVEIAKVNTSNGLGSFDLSDIESLDVAILNMEKKLIAQALTQSKGKIAKAARILKVEPWTLRYKVKKYKISEAINTKQ